MSLYKPQGEPFTHKVLIEAGKKLSKKESDLITTNIDRVDTKLRRIKASKNGNAKTGFGRMSGVELMAALGAWMSRVAEKSPEDWDAMLRAQRKTT